MNIYQVRVFKNQKWHVVRSYAIAAEAQEWAKGLEVNWDIKEIALTEAVA